jgi:hypothetical protein
MTIRISAHTIDGHTLDSMEFRQATGVFSFTPDLDDHKVQPPIIGRVQVEITPDHNDPRVTELLRELAVIDEYVRRAALTSSTDPAAVPALLQEINVKVATYLRLWDTKPLGVITD